MKNIIFTFIFLFSFQSIATQFSGTWIGIGTLDGHSVGHLNIDAVVFEFFDQGENILASKDCWNFQYEGNPWRYCSKRALEIKNGDVFYKGNKIGTASESKIDVDYIEGAEAIKASAEIQADGTLNYFFHAVNSTNGNFLKQQATGLVRQTK